MITLNNIHYTLIDLTHPLAQDAPTWSGECGFNQRIIVDYPEACRVQSIVMNAGTGTHLDAPLHFIPGGKSIAEIPLAELMVPLYVLPIAHKIHADYYVTREDVIQFEKEYGTIQLGSLFIACTGWDQFWPDAKKYRNCDTSGQMHFPGFTKDAAEFLLERGVVGIGIDTLSPDCLDLTFPVHYLILGAGKYIVENLTNCHLLPPIGSYGLMLPIKTVAGTEAVMRAVGLVP